MKKLLTILLLMFILSPTAAFENEIADDVLYDVDEIIAAEIDNEAVWEAGWETEDEFEEEFEVIDRISPDFEAAAKRKINFKKQVKTLAPIAIETKKEDEGSLNIKKGNFSISSTSRKANNDYMKEILRQRTEAKYERKIFEVTGGLETKYENHDASKNSQSLFFAPKIKFNDQFSFMLSNKTNPTGTVVEQEFGLNYRPKLFENSTFGVTGGTVFKNGVETSQKMRFSSDFFLW